MAPNVRVSTGILTSYTYDANGNQLTSASTYTSGAQNGTTFKTTANTYNLRGQLSGVSVTENGATSSMQYLYDSDGLLKQKTGESNENFYWDNGQLTMQKFGTGAEYRLNFRGMELLGTKTETEMLRYRQNARGDVIWMSNGTDTKTYFYDPFGQQVGENGLASTDTADENPLRYCGEYLDAHSENYYLRNRYYNPATGRFTQEDPIRDGLNWYVYCGNNPVMFVDPWGLDSYIFYLAEWEAEAQSDKQDLIDMGVLENEIHLVSLDSADDLKNGWNQMGLIEDGDGNIKTVSIDYVIINTHASPTNLAGKDKTGNWWHFDSADIAALDEKNVKKNILIYGCNAGHLDYKYSNPAATFAEKTNGAIVLASDGTVSMKDSDGFYTSMNDATFLKWRNIADPLSCRTNEGWVVYRYNGKSVTTRVADSGSKKLIVWGGCQLIY